MLGARLHAAHCYELISAFSPRLGLAPPPTQLISVKALTCLKESTWFPIEEVDTEQASLLLQSEMRIAIQLSHFWLNQQRRKSPCFCFVYMKFKAMGWYLLEAPLLWKASASSENRKENSLSP